MGARQNGQIVTATVNTNSSATCSCRQYISTLDYCVIATIDMQSKTKRRRIICCLKISCPCSISSKKRVIIYEDLIVSVNGVAKEIPAIYLVAEILQYSQFRFHKIRIIAVRLMAHQTVFKFDMSQKRYVWHIWISRRYHA
ncbi:hypothetical protein D3C80_993610 [compost metagenome]